MKKLYVDTNIWIDYWKDRKSGFLPLGDFAMQMFNRVYDCEFTVLISDQIISELKDNLGLEFYWRLKPFKDIDKLLMLHPNANLILAAKYLTRNRKIHFSDSLHACFAKKENAILVTRDNHFEQVRDIINICYPEEL